MRTLHADLTAAQQAATRTPYMRVYIEKGATNYTVTIADELLMVDHIERRWGGEAAITIDDSAGDWKTRDLRGYKVTIGYGYDTASGELKSDAQPLWVFQDEVVSQAGKITKVLHCIDLLTALQVFTVGEGADRIDGDPATIVGSFVAGETITGNNSSDTATLLSASPVGHDDPHIMVRGASGDFSGDTVATGDGGATLTDAGGLGYIGGGSGVSIGWNGTLSIQNAVTHLLAGFCSLTAHGTDTTRAFTPTIIIDWNTPVLNVIRYVMEMTKSVLRVENDGNADMYYLDPAPGSADYTYGATHVIFNSTQRRGIAEPERVVFVNQFPTEFSDYTYYGADETTTAGLIEGWKITRVYQDPSIGSDADAASRADAAVHQAEQNSSIGLLVVPHNCGQEIADWVTATDPRTSQEFSGRVQQLRHIWQPGSYLLELVLGGMREASRPWTMPLKELQEELEGYARWDEAAKSFEPVRLPGYRELIREMEALYEEEVQPAPVALKDLEAIYEEREVWEEEEVADVRRWILQQQLPPTELPRTPEQAERAREELRELAQRQFPWIEEQMGRLRGWRERAGQWMRDWLRPRGAGGGGGGGFR